MYDVLDVSRYVINYSNEKEYGVSNLKLQKLLYFIQAYFLVDTDVPCFRARIEAWDFGPVVPEVYHEYKMFGNCNIPSQNTFSLISKNDKKKIEKVVDSFANYSATDLVSITHNQTPWKTAYKKWMNNEITIESIRRYFNE